MAAVSIVVLVEARGEESVFSYERRAITIGSAASCDLALAHDSVGPTHAHIQVTGDDETGEPKAFAVTHLDRLAQTIVDGEPILTTTRVYDGDVLVIGDYRVTILDREPPRGEEAAFLAALERDPRDDQTRVVYADWLEEHGYPEGAELVRAQLAVRGLEATDPRFQELASRIRELAPVMPMSWRRAVAPPHIENCEARAEVACPKRWDALAATDHPSRRHCGSCDQIVYYTPDIEIAREHVRRGRCIAIDVATHRWHSDLGPPPPAPGYFLPPPRVLDLSPPPTPGRGPGQR